MNPRIHFRLGISLLYATTLLGAGTWRSDTVGREITLELLEPATATLAAGTPPPVIFYLIHLGASRVGTESDDSIIADFRAQGCLVAVLDYANDPRARMPALAGDLAALRNQLQHKMLFPGRTIDAAHAFIVPSGCRLKRDVVFYREPARTLAMDIIYPSKPAQPVGAVLQFSCDNANRMGNFSLDFCTDVLLPGAAIEGFAAAMADHPVGAPYSGFDPMPDSARKIKAAVRTLRAEAGTLPLNSRIVPAGFSRGSGMALMLATTADISPFDGFGEHPEVSSRVQGTVVMSGRFTYLDLLPNDKMIPRYEKTWGLRESHPDTWRAQGALDYLQHRIDAPLFLTINSSESPEALHQMEVLRRRLTELGSPFVYVPEPDPRGHKMPVDPDVLGNLFRYLHEQLIVAPGVQPTSDHHP